MPIDLRHLSLEDAGLEFLALFSEQMYAFGQASQANTANVAIKNFTRSIHCANHVRCLSPDLFDGDCRDFFLLAHARRARLEGDMAQGERIVAHFDRQGSGSLRDYRFRDASGVTISLFSLADIRFYLVLKFFELVIVIHLPILHPLIQI